MKIRAGFVSNSSSSSWVVDLPKAEVEKELKKYGRSVLSVVELFDLEKDRAKMREWFEDSYYELDDSFMEFLRRYPLQTLIMETDDNSLSSDDKDYIELHLNGHHYYWG